MEIHLAEDGRLLYEKRGNFQPYEEVLDQQLDCFQQFLGDRQLRALVLPVCSFAFVDQLLELNFDLYKIILLFPSQKLLDEWRANYRGSASLECILWDDEQVFYESVGKCQAALCEASILAYFPERFRRFDRVLKQRVESGLLKALQNAATQVAHKTLRSWHETLNLLTNLQKIKSHKMLSSGLGGKFVIVGAGPSLDDTVQSLKSYQNKARIVVCDAALRTLLNAGVKPDFVVTLESHYGSSRFFSGLEDQLSDVPLVYYPSSNPYLLELYPGPLLAVKNLSEDHCFANHFEAVPYLFAGTCVGHVAFSFAEFCGAEEIIMTGFDLAYKGDVFHCSAMSTKYYEDGDCAIPVTVPGALGGELKTDASMRNFLEIFEKQIELTTAKVIDATEGGALKRGTEIMTLEKALVLGESINKSTLSLREGLFPSFDLPSFIKALKSYEGSLKSFVADYLNGVIEADLLSEFCSFRQLTLLKDLGEAAVDMGALAKELDDAVELLSAYGDCVEGVDSISNRYLLFTDGGLKSSQIQASYPELELREVSCEGDLSRVWRAVKEYKAEGLVFDDSLLPPEAWVIPGVKAIEYKHSEDSKHYEFCAWGESYQILAESSCYDFWRAKLPDELTVKSLS